MVADGELEVAFHGEYRQGAESSRPRRGVAARVTVPGKARTARGLDVMGPTRSLASVAAMHPQLAVPADQK
jgi:hypothetical protein